MPVSENLSKFTTGTFAFSGTNINDLESSEYTLVVLCMDTSYSIGKFTDQMQKCITEVVKSCQMSPRSDNLLLRVLTFDTKPKEFHGFKELNKCDLTQYDNLMKNLGGATALYDAAVDGVESLAKYGKELCDNDYTCNALLVIITDGDDNNSSQTINSIKTKLSEAVGEKQLESLTSILIGVNIDDPGIGILLNDFHNKAGFSQYIDAGKVSDKTIAKLANFISKSISSQSQALNSGQASQSLSF